MRGIYIHMYISRAEAQQLLYAAAVFTFSSILIFFLVQNPIVYLVLYNLDEGPTGKMVTPCRLGICLTFLAVSFCVSLCSIMASIIRSKSPITWRYVQQSYVCSNIVSQVRYSRLIGVTRWIFSAVDNSARTPSVW